MAEETILGLDLSTARTGWCLIDCLGLEVLPRIELGSWECRGEDFPQIVGALTSQAVALIRRKRESNLPITKAVIEAPIRRPPMRKRKVGGDLFAAREEWAQASAPNVMLNLYALQGAAQAILALFEIETELVPAETWRKYYLGVGRAPSTIPKGKGTAWLKKQAVEKTEALSLKLDFTVPNHDAAEACGVACWMCGARLGLFRQVGRLIAQA